MNREALIKASPEEAAIMVREMQVANWNKVSKFCGACGSQDFEQEKDGAKVCAACGTKRYQLLQPVAIVLVKRGQELLLARGLPPRKHYSCLAGFVEAGERIEDTIHREIKEEVGVEVENIRYFGSQPWPFPSNLMIGYIADYKSGEIVIDETEITDARWFTKDQPPEVTPPPISIARQMIDSIWK